jgi:hypothetical protein
MLLSLSLLSTLSSLSSLFLLLLLSLPLLSILLSILFTVSIGESTCASKLWAAPLGSIGASRNGGQGLALFEVSELSQIAMERARTAREAIQIIGSLAEKYGFYSADYESRYNIVIVTIIIIIIIIIDHQIILIM